jgi:hypothetical protein
VEAAVHGLAEKYMVPELKKLCQDAYEIIVRQASQPLDKEDLIGSIRVIYNTTKSLDKLRHVAVWLVQDNLKARSPCPALEQLIRSEPDLAWDVATRGKALRWVWCASCAKRVRLLKMKCCCGMIGFCRETAACGVWKMLRCSRCGEEGSCQRDEPAIPNDVTGAQDAIFVDESMGEQIDA